MDFGKLAEAKTHKEMEQWQTVMRASRMENIEDHANEIGLSVPPIDPEREKELELVDKLLDLCRAVLMKAKA